MWHEQKLSVISVKQYILLNSFQLAKNSYNSVTATLQYSKLICTVSQILAEMKIQFWLGKCQWPLVCQYIFIDKLNTSDSGTSIISLQFCIWEWTTWFSRTVCLTSFDGQQLHLIGDVLVTKHRSEGTLHRVRISKEQYCIIIFHLFPQTNTKISQWLTFILGVSANYYLIISEINLVICLC